MDWENESWIKLYTRETGETVAMGWEARALLREMLCKCDRAGLIQVDSDEDLAALVRMPSHVVTACHTVLRERGVVSRTDHGLLVHNFIEAQEARTSDKERQRRSRARRRDIARLESEDVTACHTVSQPVTNRIDKKRIEKNREGARKRAHALPDSWKPTDKHVAKALAIGADLAEEVASFRDHHLAKGSSMKDWGRAFNTWLRNSEKFATERKAKQPTAPEIKWL